jgi:uncharacterized FlaG/YvyC family protein
MNETASQPKEFNDISERIDEGLSLLNEKISNSIACVNRISGAETEKEEDTPVRADDSTAMGFLHNIAEKVKKLNKSMDIVSTKLNRFI